MAVGCSDWQVSSGAIWALLCYVEYVHGACRLEGSPSSKAGGLELASRVAVAAGRAQARARLIEKSDLSFWKFHSTIVHNGEIETLEIICAGLTLDP